MVTQKRRRSNMASRPNFPQRIEKRRAAAKERQEAYDKVPIDQKIKKQEAYQGKEYRRLLAKTQK
jgi:hypothetical protein